MASRNPVPESRLQAARAHLQQKRFPQAHAALLTLVRQHPDDAEVNRMLAEACENLRKTSQALHYAARAREIAPDNPAVILQYARCLAESHGVPKAVDYLREALQRHPLRRDLRGELAMMLLNSDRLVEAADLCKEGLALDPEADAIRAAYAMVLRKAGRLDEARDILRDLQWRRPGEVFPVEYLSVLLLYDPDATPEAIFALHQHYGRLVGNYAADLRFDHPPTDDPQRRLRVGLLSPDLYAHSVAYFTEPIVEGLGREEFEVTCYHTGSKVDDVTRRIERKADRFRHAFMADSPTIATRIHADRIDILIDLTGLYSGHRMHAMALRPAPVQMTYIGYPATTGVPNIDYRIVDSLTDPRGRADQYATERLLRLDPVFLCYRPPEGAPEVDLSPRPADEPFTFGSFNSAIKINAKVVRAWAEVLGAVPRSRLLLKGLGLNQSETRAEFVEKFRAAGVDPARLELVPPTDHWRDHLALYSRVDLALDTFPYNGTTTTCEALFMGVPVVSIEGVMHPGRVGLSLLSAVGLRDFVAPEEGDYIRLASTLARDPMRLRALRASLRRRLLASPLCDVRGYGQRLGALLREAWRVRCADGVGRVRAR